MASKHQHRPRRVRRYGREAVGDRDNTISLIELEGDEDDGVNSDNRFHGERGKGGNKYSSVLGVSKRWLSLRSGEPDRPYEWRN